MQINTSKIDQETLVILQDSELMQDIESGQVDIAAGNFISHEEMKKQTNYSCSSKIC